MNRWPQKFDDRHRNNRFKPMAFVKSKEQVKEKKKVVHVSWKVPSRWLESGNIQPEYFHFKYPYSRERNYRYFTTDPSFSKFVKLTIQALGFSTLIEMRSKLFEEMNIARLPAKERINIGYRHCTACYGKDHKRDQCRVCSYCLEMGHMRTVCPENPKRDKTIMSIAGNLGESNSVGRKCFTVYEGKPWFRRNHEFNPQYLALLKPIGPPDEKIKTVAVDAEGYGGGRTVGCVNVVGWVGCNKGQCHDLYFASIKNWTRMKDPKTAITGIQIEDFADGVPLTNVQSRLKEILAHKRVIVHGGNDLEHLGIDQEFLFHYGVKVVDTATMFNQSLDKQPIALSKLVKFFAIKFWDRDNSKSLIQGHSSERDARATLKCYEKATKLLLTHGKLPTKEKIEDFIALDKNWKDWKKETEPSSVIRHRRIPELEGLDLHALTSDEKAFHQLFVFPVEPIEQRSYTPVSTWDWADL